MTNQKSIAWGFNHFILNTVLWPLTTVRSPIAPATNWGVENDWRGTNSFDEIIPCQEEVNRKVMGSNTITGKGFWSLLNWTHTIILFFIFGHCTTLFLIIKRSISKSYLLKPESNEGKKLRLCWVHPSLFAPKASALTNNPLPHGLLEAR